MKIGLEIAAIVIVIFCHTGCKKAVPANEIKIIEAATLKHVPGYTTYTIAEGNHFCEQSEVKPVTLSELKFRVIFDSSAIYQTLDPSNQFDINKLYGFTDGNDPHLNSARIGWSWNNGALHLYAYVYAAGVREAKKIATANLGVSMDCSIRIEGSHYVFQVNDFSVKLKRSSSHKTIQGYQLYPYFGGNETAPRTVFIYIKED